MDATKGKVVVVHVVVSGWQDDQDWVPVKILVVIQVYWKEFEAFYYNFVRSLKPLKDCFTLSKLMLINNFSN